MYKRTNLALLLVAMMLSACAPVLFGGATTTGVVIANNRTAGAFVEDEGIEIKLLRDLLDEVGDGARYSAVSINRVVLVVGQAPDEAMKSRIIRIAENQENVRRVIDEMTIGEPISLKQIAKDTLITTNVKANLLQVQEGDFSSLNIKVLTENGVVYLMGLDTKTNAAIAVSEARKVTGVRRVVKAFEFIEETQAQ